jgi:hypothetical protein
MSMSETQSGPLVDVSLDNNAYRDWPLNEVVMQHRARASLLCCELIIKLN